MTAKPANGAAAQIRLTVSIVTYKSNPEQFVATLESLCAAMRHAKQSRPMLATLFIVDNEASVHSNVDQASQFFQGAEQVFDQVFLEASKSNLGYGGGHNVAIFAGPADYHLVLNPDVILDQDAISVGLDCMERNALATVVTPSGFSPEGEPLFLCKQFPLVFDLFLRGFAPYWLRRRFLDRVARYEMHGLSSALAEVTGVPIVSGCCMLLRGETLRELGGFDEKYFLYFEDFDLSLRLGRVGSNIYLPAMKIVHYGGRAARKGVFHILLFVRSAIRFYNQYGWRWFRE